MKHATRILFLAFILMTLDARASSISCDKDSFLIRTETGRWGYGQINCNIAVDNVDNGVNAVYEGNLSDKIEARATKETGEKYLIELIVDANSAEKASFKGKVELTTDLGESLIIFPATVRIGQAEQRDITLSKETLRFMFTKPGYKDCYTVEVENTGTVDLDDLHAEVTDWASPRSPENNDSWITVSDIDADTFKAGKKKDLDICVNNYDNRSAWDNRQSAVRVTAGNVEKEIKVYLSLDQESELQKKYDLLQYQYDFLQKAYNRERIYRTLYQSLNATYSSLSSNYSTLKSNYTNLSIKLENIENGTGQNNKTNATKATTTTTSTSSITTTTETPSSEVGDVEKAFIESLRKRKKPFRQKTDPTRRQTALPGMSWD